MVLCERLDLKASRAAPKALEPPQDGRQDQDPAFGPPLRGQIRLSKADCFRLLPN